MRNESDDGANLDSLAQLADFDDLKARVRFQAPHLERVSRSFAFGIRRLDLGLRAQVGLGYLICRLLDTIEDARWTSGEAQKAAFDEFNGFLQTSSIDVPRVRAWAKTFPNGISPGERLLLDDCEHVFHQFATLEVRERAAMLNPILSMSRGMKAFTSRARETGDLKLKDLTDVNVYCFFVAGVVGELLTALVQAEMRPIGRESVWSLAVQFGLFLQKVNVLKDQRTDEREHRYLVPNREDVLSSLKEDAIGAFHYLLAIPSSRQDYRLFCAWALFLGLATVPLLRAQPFDQEEPKLSRLKAAALGSRIELIVRHDEKLKRLFDELMQAAWATEELGITIKREKDPDESCATNDEQAVETLMENYRGQLDVKELAELLRGQRS